MNKSSTIMGRGIKHRLTSIPPPSVPLMGIAVEGGWYLLSTGTLASYFSTMAANGVEIVRNVINWHVIQNSGSSSFNWTGHDNVVNAANAVGIQILGVLGGCPSWAGIGGASGWTQPASTATFATFCGQAVARYAAMGVHYYEVWNEPNIINFWSNGPNAANYTALLIAATPAIRAADPSAFIVSAGLSPATDTAPSIAPTTFLTSMYANGAAGDFDAVGWHPYNTPNLPNEFATWSAWSQMSETTVNARGIMTANGDAAKPIWATEYGVATGGTGGTTVTEASQALHVTDAYAEARANDWLGPVFWYTWISTEVGDRVRFMGIVHADGTPKPALSAYLTASQQ